MAASMPPGTTITMENRRHAKILQEFLRKSTDVLREIFHKTHPKDPKELLKALKKYRAEIKWLRNQKIISPTEYFTIFLKGKTETNSEEYDSTLLYKLIANLPSTIQRPKTGWINMPKEEDESDGAHIVRLHHARNRIQHSTAFVPVERFKEIKTVMSNALIGLGVDKKELQDLIPAIRCGYFLPVTNFSSRENNLQMIHQKLVMEPCNQKPKRVVIHGMPGIGKSELARRYFEMHEEVFDRNVLWINASTEKLVYESLKNIGEQIGMQNAETTKGINALANDIYKWFEQEKVLYVFDDVVDMKSIIKLLPQYSPSYTIITTQNANWSPHFDQLKLLRFTEAESEKFVVTNIDKERQLTENQLKDVLKLLAGHPLAVQQFVAFINNSFISVTKYVEYFKKQTAKLLKEKINIRDEELSAIVTISIALEKLSEHPLCHDLISTMAFMHGDEIFFTFLCHVVDNEELEIDKAVRTLISFSLINQRRSPESENPIITIHSLIQKTVRLEQDQKTTKKHLLAVFQAFFKGNESTSTMHVDYGKIWYKHLLFMISEHIDEKVFLDECTKHMDFFYSVMHSKGWLDSYSTLSDAIMKVSGDNGFVRFSHKNQRAKVLNYMGRYKDAAQLFEELVNEQKSLGSLFYDEAILKNNLAECYRELERYDEAIQIYNALLRKEKDLFKIQILKNNLALCLIAMGQPAKGHALLKEVWEQFKKYLGEDHERTLKARKCYISNFKGKNGIEMWKEQVEIESRVFGKYHPFTMVSMNNLGDLLNNHGRYEEARILFEELVKKRDEIEGPDHSYTLTSKNNLACSLHRLGRYEEAEDLYEKTLRKKEALFGQTHSGVLTTKSNLHGCYLCLGKFEKAFALFGLYGVQNVNSLLETASSLYFNSNKKSQGIEMLHAVLLKVHYSPTNIKVMSLIIVLLACFYRQKYRCRMGKSLFLALAPIFAKHK